MQYAPTRDFRGIYRPSTLDKAVTAFYALFVCIFCAAMIHVSGGYSGLDGSDKVFCAVFGLVALIMVEVNLRTVKVDDLSISQRSPLGLYRQKFKHEELTGIRNTRMARGDIIEVCYQGRWIVFCSNRRFRRYVQGGPNQALLPTPTAVTIPAAQDSRQP